MYDPSTTEWVDSMGVRRGGAKRAFASPLEIETKKENFLEKLKLAAQFRSSDLILAMAVYVPVWHTLHASQVHCFGVTHCFHVMLLCSDGLADHSYPVQCLQRQVVKLASGLFRCWSLLRNNNMATNLHRFTSSNGRKGFLSHVTDCWKAHIFFGRYRPTAASDCW